MNHELPQTQHAVQLLGPNELALNTEKPVVEPKGHQILARVEATSLCFSDMKLLHQFTAHPRKSDVITFLKPEELEEIPSYVPNETPTVPGHETVVRIIAVGDQAKHHQVGRRYTMQTDYRVLETTAGSNAGFGYSFEGALQEYVIIDERVAFDYDLRESMLVQVDDDRCAAGIALLEPWACVENSLTNPERQSMRPGGTTLVIVDRGRQVKGLRESFAPEEPPQKVYAFCETPGDREAITDLVPDAVFVDSIADLAANELDDIVYFGSQRETIETFNAKLGFQGIANVVTSGTPIGKPAAIGVGRIHYGLRRWIGTDSDSAADSYGIIPSTGNFRDNDRCLIVGAGGPMGQMQVLRAIFAQNPGLSVIATELDAARRQVLTEKLRPIAEEHGVPFEVIDPTSNDPGTGFTHVTLMVPSPELMAECLDRCGSDAIVNVFAGIPAPTIHPIDVDALIRKRCFVYGTSGSLLMDLKVVWEKVRAGQIHTELSIDAVSGMAGAIDGLHAVDQRTRAGKIVVYPELHDLGLIPLADLPERFPTVAAKLSDGRWNRDAEEELLRVAAPQR